MLRAYNITVLSISLNFESAQAISLADQIAQSGVVVVCAAGNDGSSDYNSNGFYTAGNNAGSIYSAPGSSDYAICAGAIARNNSVTSYSSQGGLSYTGNTIKPDIVAPGGEWSNQNDINTPLVLAQNNANLFLSEDQYTGAVTSLPNYNLNATSFWVGTSFAAPMVAGVALLIQNAMGGMQAWQYTLNDVLTVKDILLATASETAPNLRDNDPTHSPILTRGGKDIQEGYGMLNPLTALQLTTNLQSGNYSNTQCLFAPNDTLANLAENSINSYDFAVNYSMSKQYYYNLELTMDPTIQCGFIRLFSCNYNLWRTGITLRVY